jgi:hypothetical protein
MSRIQIQPALLLLAVAALTGPLAAQTRSQEPPKEPVKVERVKEAPKQAAPKVEAPSAETREIAKKAAHFEALHRDRIARIDRLIAVYTAKGDRAKVTELEALRESQMKRHGNAIEGFRKQIGPDAWGRLEKEMKGPSARAREMRDEHANQNEKEREARKAAEAGKGGEKPAPEKPKDKPPARPGGKN